MRSAVFAFFFVVANSFYALGGETPEEFLSRYLGRIEVADGTNVIVRTREWGGGLLFWRNGWLSYYSIGTGEEEVVRCGESVSFVYSGGPALTVSVDSDVGLEKLNDIFPEGANRMTIRIRDSYRMDGSASMKYDAKLDIVVLPSLGKTYDVLTGRYIDLRFPFKNMWSSRDDMISYREKQRHVNYSMNATERSKAALFIANKQIKEDLTFEVESGCCRCRDVQLPLAHGMTNMVACISDRGNVRAVRAYYGDGGVKAYAYSVQGQLDWYLEIGRSLKKTSELEVSVLLHFDETGMLQESFHANYVPQYLVVSNGMMRFMWHRPLPCFCHWAMPFRARGGRS